MRTGKVWLVGAGPGETDLLTLKAKRVIEQAEVVIYDRLVGPGVRLLIPETAACIDAGKRAGKHTMPQEQINRLLLQEALLGKQVVRLKGGDPFLFGRGGEELELLHRYGIPYEIIPGITSAISVPAYQGIPVTHRDFSSSVHIITGHMEKGRPLLLDYEALVRTQGTLVFLMGVAALPQLCRGLICAGLEADMPAAILQRGTTARQKRIIATVGTLEREAQEQGVETPAVILVGRVCQLAEDFSWYEKLPLAGKRIVVTRPKELSSTLAAKLKAGGAEVLEVPAIRICRCKEGKQLKQAITELEQYQWLVFTSPSGVDVFFEAMREERADVRRLAGIKLAALGEGTRRRVEDKGLLVDFIPSCYDGRALGEMVRVNAADTDRILIPRASTGNEEIVEEIKKNHSLTVRDVPAYDTVYSVSAAIDLKEELEQGGIDYVVFTSKSTVKGFVRAVGVQELPWVKAVCIGEQTREEAKKHKMLTWMSPTASVDSLVETIERLCKHGDRNR